MFLKITWATEEFSTRITFVIFLSFMKCLHMLGKISWSGEGFSTRIAFVISLSLMNCPDVYLQTSLCSEKVSTRFTIIIPLSFMKCLHVIIQMSWLSEPLFTRVAFVFLFFFLVKILNMPWKWLLTSIDSQAHIALESFLFSMNYAHMFGFENFGFKYVFADFTFEIFPDFDLWRGIHLVKMSF